MLCIKRGIPEYRLEFTDVTEWAAQSQRCTYVVTTPGAERPQTFRLNENVIGHAFTQKLPPLWLTWPIWP